VKLQYNYYTFKKMKAVIQRVMKASVTGKKLKSESMLYLHFVRLCDCEES
jgi:hypothetical protein